VGIIHKGRMVAQGPIEELRGGGEPGRTLEEIFLGLVGAGERAEGSLGWLGA